MAVAVLMHKRTLGVYLFALLKASTGLWAFASLFEVCSRHLETKIFAYSLKYLFIVLVPIAWYMFGLYYSDRLRKLHLSRIMWLLIIPAITVLLVATNRYHHLMFTSLDTVETVSYVYIVRKFGTWFWIHATYSYVLLLLGFFFMAKHLIDSPSHYRWPVATLLVGGLTPWAANMVFTFNLMPYPYLDLTPFAFTISGLAFMVGIVRFQLLDVVPIAQQVVIDNIDVGIIVVDGEQRLLNLNPAAKRLADVPGSRQIGEKAEDVFSWWAKLDMAGNNADRPGPNVIELCIDNQRRLLRSNTMPLFSNLKESGTLITLHDVTDTLLAKEALRVSEERFRSLSENAPVIIFALEPDGTISYLNPAFKQILNYDRKAMLGQSFIDLISEDDKSVCMSTFTQLIEKQKTVAELNIALQSESGPKRLFNISLAASFDAGGTVSGIVGMAKDISEEHELQYQLFQSQKMEAVGTLAGGIAHDFNNLLMGMQANLSLMRIEHDTDKDQMDKVNRIEAQIQSGANLTRQLLGYARKGKYVVTSVNLNRLIEETLTVVQRTNKAITIESRLCADPMIIKADRGQIEMVLLNLFVNAMDAMPDGGRLIVSTRHVADMNYRKEAGKKDRYCELLVTDTGTGMDSATQKRIFEPFFTTKAVGRGTGLGLASVYGVVQNHGGHIRVDSKMGEGTTFTLHLPTVREAAAKKETPKQCSMAEENSGKILLVEDEPQIREYSFEMIQSLGYEVLMAENGEEAVEIFEKHQADIDMVVLDIVMPGMNGLMVYKALSRINPQIRVLVSSGYAKDKRIDDILSCGRHAYLKKPYSREELSRKMGEILSLEFAQK